MIAASRSLVVRITCVGIHRHLQLGQDLPADRMPVNRLDWIGRVIAADGGSSPRPALVPNPWFEVYEDLVDDPL